MKLILIAYIILNSFINEKIIVELQPYNNFKINEIKELVPKLKEFITNELNLNPVFIIKSPQNLSDDLYNVNHSRYRGNKIINKYKQKASKKHIIIGLLHDDISTTLRNHDDWGILGLSILNTYTCVVSDYRLKNKNRDYWKVIIHEFIHTYYCVSHCSKDVETCIMKDAKGKANFKNKFKLCDYCKYNLKLLNLYKNE